MDWQLVLEYVRAVLSPHVVWGGVVLWACYLFREDAGNLLSEVGNLLRRLVKLKGPGGLEISAGESQAVLNAEKPVADDRAAPALVAVADATTSTDSTTASVTVEANRTQETIEGLKATARIWEFRYLHYFLARSTQIVLDWLAGLPNPVTWQAADAWWYAAIPDVNERRAIFNALRWHDLVQLDGDVIRVTEKGREYLKFRGPLPSPRPSEVAK